MLVLPSRRVGFATAHDALSAGCVTVFGLLFERDIMGNTGVGASGGEDRRACLDALLAQLAGVRRLA